MSRKLSIGYVLDDTLDTPDGVQQYVLTVGEWMRSQGHTVHYLVGETYRTDIINVHSLTKNVRVTFNKNKLSIPRPANKQLLRQKLADLQLDVLHVQMPYSPLFAGRLIQASTLDTNIIGTFHIVPATWLEKTGAKTLQLITRNTLRRFDAIVSVSPAAQSFASTTFGIQSVIIPNTVQLAQYTHQPIYRAPLHIVFLGRLVERKGCTYLLQALAKLNQMPNLPPYRVTVAGKGHLLGKLRDYAASHHLSNVSFVGFVDEQDKPILLASADIAVFPSTGGESFGIVLIEAMAAGTRVIIGGDNIGYRSVLGGYELLLVRPQNTSLLAERLYYFIKNETARNKVYRWLQTEKLQYDVTNVGKKLLAIYENKHKQ